ncbi:hypothetical protein GGU11DRAFT_794464 [Lentinula aff. detonsa]|nr:hypothetical protein GGU11DRAFT_794464 [Lentinula aff. detonsa]
MTNGILPTEHFRDCFSHPLSLFKAFNALYACSTPLSSRQVESGHGILSAPTSGIVVAQGSSFPFEFRDSNWCEDGYSPIAVWLTDYAPSASSLNSTGQFAEGGYTYYFGSYLIPNFGMFALH